MIKRTKRVCQTIKIPKLDSAEEYSIFTMGVRTAYLAMYDAQQISADEIISAIESTVKEMGK